MNGQIRSEKRRFNIIDLLIILVLIATASFALHVLINDIFTQNITAVEYVLRLEGVDTEKVSRLETNDSLISASASTPLGHIVNLQAIPYQKTVFNYTSDRYQYADISGKSTLLLTVQANCAAKDEMYTIGDYVIAANTSPILLLPFEYETCEIVSVKPANLSE